MRTMSKRRLRAIETEMEEARKTFAARVEKYADEYWFMIMLPLCRAKRLDFASGNGSWSFYDRQGNTVDHHDPGFKYLEPIERELNTEVFGHTLFGHYMRDVTNGKDY